MPKEEFSIWNSGWLNVETEQNSRHKQSLDISSAVDFVNVRIWGGVRHLQDDPTRVQNRGILE